VLATEDSPIAFNELQQKASVSSRTLAEHLKNFTPTIAQKVGRKYRITQAGIERLKNIEQDLETWKRRGKRDYVEAVEVYFIGPEYSGKGILRVTSPKPLEVKEYAKMDAAITSAFGTFRSLVPKDSKNWRLSVYSHINAKP
jgi:hypothetical protein